jgi:flagellar biogenesis protein FliO
MTPFATYIVETLVTLLAVIALAVLVLVSARRLGLGRPLGPLELVGRLPLEGRRAVYLVRVAQRVYVLGASEAGLEKLGELDSDTIAPRSETKGGFREVLSRILERKQEAHDGASSTGGSGNATS